VQEQKRSKKIKKFYSLTICGTLAAEVFMSFALKLKELREEKRLSQAQLARELNVGIGSVGMWESTRRTPPAKRLQQIANYFGVTVDELLDPTPDEQVAGASATRRVSVTPIEDELLYAFRKLGRKHGEQTQRSIIDMIEKML